MVIDPPTEFITNSNYLVDILPSINTLNNQLPNSPKPQRIKTRSTTDGSPLLDPLSNDITLTTPKTPKVDTIVSTEVEKQIKIFTDDSPILTSDSNSLISTTSTSSISNSNTTTLTPISSSTPDSIIHFHTLQVPPTDTLLVGILIKDSSQNKLLTALVDTCLLYTSPSPRD